MEPRLRRRDHQRNARRALRALRPFSGRPSDSVPGQRGAEAELCAVDGGEFDV